METDAPESSAPVRPARRGNRIASALLLLVASALCVGSAFLPLYSSVIGSGGERRARVRVRRAAAGPDAGSVFAAGAGAAFLAGVAALPDACLVGGGRCGWRARCAGR